MLNEKQTRNSLHAGARKARCTYTTRVSQHCCCNVFCATLLRINWSTGTNLTATAAQEHVADKPFMYIHTINNNIGVLCAKRKIIFQLGQRVIIPHSFQGCRSFRLRAELNSSRRVGRTRKHKGRRHLQCIPPLISKQPPVPRSFPKVSHCCTCNERLCSMLPQKNKSKGMMVRNTNKLIRPGLKEMSGLQKVRKTPRPRHRCARWEGEEGTWIFPQNKSAGLHCNANSYRQTQRTPSHPLR